jgi:hypothetical protein
MSSFAHGLGFVEAFIDKSKRKYPSHKSPKGRRGKTSHANSKAEKRSLNRVQNAKKVFDQTED